MRKFSRPTHTVGHPPGTLKANAEKTQESIAVKLIAYDKSSLDEQEFERVEDCFTARRPETLVPGSTSMVCTTSPPSNRWASTSSCIRCCSKTSPTRYQRSKVEQYDGKTYIVVRLLEFDAESEEIESSQISIVLTDNTLDHVPRASEQCVRRECSQRVRSGRPRMRASGIPYLAYSLLDAVVDRYFVLLEKLGEHMENLEEALVGGSGPGDVERHPPAQAGADLLAQVGVAAARGDQYYAARRRLTVPRSIAHVPFAIFTITRCRSWKQSSRTGT